MFRYDVSSICVCVDVQDLCTGSLQGLPWQGAGIIGLCDITFVGVEHKWDELYCTRTGGYRTQVQYVQMNVVFGFPRGPLSEVFGPYI